MSSTIDLDYSYVFSSELVPSTPNSRRLSLATSGGLEKNPFFFSGRFTSPKRSSDLLLTLSAISRSRFFSPGELRERMKAAADPVVTSDGQQLRFEVFSVCCGVYGRLDLHSEAFEGDWIGVGSTNVDFNPAMRSALAGVMNSEDVEFRVGAESVELERHGDTFVERKVKLPVRWLKSFVEVQVYQSNLKPAMEISAWQMTDLIRNLPQQNIMHAGTFTYLVQSKSGVRLTQRNTAGAVAVGAISRLKALEPILAYAQSVKIYSNDTNVAGFELIFDDGSFTFVLSPTADRGFSGEGQALPYLVKENLTDVVERVRSALTWQREISTHDLSCTLGVSEEKIFGALQILGSRGLAGFDISAGKFFHRQLPFDLALVEALQPRMKKARDLFNTGKVRVAKVNAGEHDVYVQGTSAQHFVKVSDTGSKCTCDWFTKNQGERGPCSHMLAADLALSAAAETV